MKITDIIIHHSGGTSDPNESTLHHDFQDIDSYHKSRWRMRSTLGHYAGYAFVYDPKTREFTQARRIGEEQIACRGKNFDSVNICIIGNYNKHSYTGQPIDKITPEVIDDVSGFINDLISDNKRGVEVLPNTTLKLSQKRIYPHRMFSATDCCGNSLSDTFWAEKVAGKVKKKAKPAGKVVKTKEVEELERFLLMLIFMIKRGIIKLGGVESDPHN